MGEIAAESGLHERGVPEQYVRSALFACNAERARLGTATRLSCAVRLMAQSHFVQGRLTVPT
jgi:hypothetical protein